MRMNTKRTIYAILACLLLCPLTSAAQKLVVTKTTVDVGKTGFNVPVTATFEVRNKALKHLEVQKVKADCGCINVDYPKKSIGTGDRFTISLTYDARQLGHFQKQVAVYTNASKEPLYLKMKGVVLAELKDYSKTYPYSFGELLADVDNVEFDNVNQGEHPEVDIHILNNSETAMTPNIQHLPPYLTALATPETLAPGQAGVITLTLGSDKLLSYGLTQRTVYLAKQLGEKVSPETELPISVVMVPKVENTSSNQPRLLLSADSLRLGLINGKLHKKETITLENNGQATLTISSLQMFTGGMKVTLNKRELQPGEQALLKISIDREKLRKTRSKPRVLMITNDPTRPKVVINVGVE